MFNWNDNKENYLIVLACGFMDIDALRRLFSAIIEAIRSLSDCWVILDLSHSTYRPKAAEVNAFVGELSPDAWPPGNKVALVSGENPGDFYRLYHLHAALRVRGFDVGVFLDSRAATDWLSGRV